MTACHEKTVWLWAVESDISALDSATAASTCQSLIPASPSHSVWNLTHRPAPLSFLAQPVYNDVLDDIMSACLSVTTSTTACNRGREGFRLIFSTLDDRLRPHIVDECRARWHVVCWHHYFYFAVLFPEPCPFTYSLHVQTTEIDKWVLGESHFTLVGPEAANSTEKKNSLASVRPRTTIDDIQ